MSTENKNPAHRELACNNRVSTFPLVSDWKGGNAEGLGGNRGDLAEMLHTHTSQSPNKPLHATATSWTLFL